MTFGEAPRSLPLVHARKTSERGAPFTTAGWRKMVARLGVAAKLGLCATAEACSGVVHRSGLFLRCSLIESFKMAEGSVCIGLRAFAGVLQSFFPFKLS
jgi:hypothetical protein